MKNLFWKICAIIFLLIMALWVWNNTIVVVGVGDYVVKSNKITGKNHLIRDGKWVIWD